MGMPKEKVKILTLDEARTATDKTLNELKKAIKEKGVK